LHIREVVRTTGLRREQLYMWQRRYGFPLPLRDGFGKRRRDTAWKGEVQFMVLVDPLNGASVLDADGKPVQPDAETIGQLLEIWPAFDAIDRLYVGPALTRLDEKNV
jgi:hypothetical protein